MKCARGALLITPPWSTTSWCSWSKMNCKQAHTTDNELTTVIDLFIHPRFCKNLPTCVSSIAPPWTINSALLATNFLSDSTASESTFRIEGFQTRSVAPGTKETAGSGFRPVGLCLDGRLGLSQTQKLLHFCTRMGESFWVGAWGVGAKIYNVQCLVHWQNNAIVKYIYLCIAKLIFIFNIYIEMCVFNITHTININEHDPSARP